MNNANDIKEAIDPKSLLAEANEAPSRGVLSKYLDTIKLLREKKEYSFQAIANWLSERGIPADHNSVYRTYHRGFKSRENGRTKANRSDRRL